MAEYLCIPGGHIGSKNSSGNIDNLILIAHAGIKKIKIKIKKEKKNSGDTLLDRRFTGNQNPRPPRPQNWEETVKTE